MPVWCARARDAGRAVVPEDLGIDLVEGRETGNVRLLITPNTKGRLTHGSFMKTRNPFRPMATYVQITQMTVFFTIYGRIDIPDTLKSPF